MDVHDERLSIDTGDTHPALPVPGVGLAELPEPVEVLESLPVSGAAAARPASSNRPGSSEPAPKPKWHYDVEGRMLGPIPERALVMKLQHGELNESTLVWCEDMDDWTEALNVAILRRYL